MVTAYVLIKVNSGNADELREEIAAIDGITRVHIVAGDVDFIAKVEVDSPAEVKEIAAQQLQQLRAVENTQTYIAMN